MNVDSASRAVIDAESGLTQAIVVNGEAVQSRARSLAALLAELGYGDAKVATALNGEFVSARRRDQTQVRAGDRIEIVAPRQGG